FEAFVTQGGLVLVDVWAPWCGPCRFLGPIVEQVAQEMAGRVKVGKVNADESPAVMDAFGIQGIPTLLLFSNGRLVDRVTGALPKPQLSAWLERHAARASGAAGPRR
ncbi:MAG TPA: thioredoxin, partial [Candidatus Thermoplasmatota archaeon]|nr:thioredoxin [Candidatus Thermoplasmatota archaeon]